MPTVGTIGVGTTGNTLTFYWVLKIAQAMVNRPSKSVLVGRSHTEVAGEHCK